MKIAVIGNGNVGLATFAELQKLSEVDEIVLIGRRLDAIKGYTCLWRCFCRC